MKNTASLKTTLGFIILTASFAPAADWPHYRGPDYNGITAETDWSSTWPASGPKILWEKSIGIGFSSFAVAGGRVYAMGNAGDKKVGPDKVFCFDAATGREIWSHSYPCPLEPKYYNGGTLSTPTVDGDRVYTLSKMGDLFCLNTANGNILWQKQMNKELGLPLPTWHFSSSALVRGDLLILNLGSAGVALNKHTGAIVWNNGQGKCGYATPVPFTQDGLKCLALFGENTIFGIREKDGKQLWKFPWKTKYDVNAADPIISGNTFFISSGYNRGCALLRLSNGQVAKVWENRKMRNHMNCCVLWKNFLYGFDESQLKCISLADGSEKWAEKSAGKGALMMSADGRLIIMSDKGELIVAQADPTAFKSLARAQILPRKRCWTTPVLVNGRIYARNAPGNMVCVDVSK